MTGEGAAAAAAGQWFPRYGTAKARVVTLQPGETLFIPALTFHHVYAATASISVNVFSAGREGSLVASLKRRGLPGLLLRHQPDPEAAQERVRLLAAFTRRLVARVRGISREDAIAAVEHELVTTRYRPLGEGAHCPDKFQPNRCPRVGTVHPEHLNVALALIEDVALEFQGLDRDQAAAGASLEYRQGARDALLFKYLEDVVAGVVGARASCMFLSCLGFPGAWTV